MNRLADLVRQRLEAPARRAKVAPNPALAAATFLGERFPSKPALAKLSGAKVRAVAAGRTVLLTRPIIRPHVKSEAEVPPAPYEVIVGTACLELSPISLSQQIYEFGQRLVAAGVLELKLLPVFLMAGVHVMEDLPTEVAEAKQLLEGSLELSLYKHLGGHPQMLDVLTKRLSSVPAEASLLVAHGSRRPKGNRGIQALGRRLDTDVAYWATSPDIEEQVIALMQKGAQRIAILPYFLFAGGITDAITHRTEELAERFPKVKFRLLPTLGATDEVADLAADILCG